MSLVSCKEMFIALSTIPPTNGTEPIGYASAVYPFVCVWQIPRFVDYSDAANSGNRRSSTYLSRYWTRGCMVRLAELEKVSKICMNYASKQLLYIRYTSKPELPKSTKPILIILLSYLWMWSW